MGLVQINDPHNLLFTGGKKTVDETHNVNRIYGDGEETPVETLDASAITYRQLLERMLDEAPQVCIKYPDFCEAIDPTRKNLKNQEEQEEQDEQNESSYDNYDIIIITPKKNICVTYEDVLYSANKLEVKFYTDFPTPTSPGTIVTLKFNGDIDQFPELVPITDMLPCGFPYTNNTLISGQDIDIKFSATTIRIILRNFTFNCTVANVCYGDDLPGEFEITKNDDTGEYKEIQFMTKELPVDRHQYQYTITFDLIVDKTNWDADDAEYEQYACKDHTEWGGGVDCIKITNSDKEVPYSIEPLPINATAEEETIVDTVTLSNLNGFATIEYRAHKNKNISISIVTDGNVSVKDLCNYTEDEVERDSGEEYVIVTPGVQTVFYTYRNNPQYARFNLIAQNLTKYATVKYRFVDQPGFEIWSKLKKSDRLEWLKHWSGNIDDSGKAKIQKDMKSWFSVDTDNDIDTYEEPVPEGEPIIHEVPHPLDFDTQYYLILNGVPVEHPVRAIMYIFQPGSDGILVHTESTPDDYTKDNMRPFDVDDSDRGIYKSHDAYTDDNGEYHPESHLYIRDMDYDGNGSLVFHMTVNHNDQDYKIATASGIYITEGAALRNPTYYPFDETKGDIESFDIAFNPPARGFYKNIQIYIRPVTVANIYVNFFKYDGITQYTETPPILLMNDDVIELNNGYFTYTNEMGKDLYLGLKKGECICNHFDCTLVYSYPNGATKIVSANDSGGIQLDDDFPDKSGTIHVSNFERAYKLEYQLNIRCSVKKNVIGRIWMLSSDDPALYFSQNRGGDVRSPWRGYIFDANSVSTQKQSASRNSWKKPVEEDGHEGYYSYEWEDVTFEHALLWSTVSSSSDNAWQPIYNGLYWWYGNKEFSEISDSEKHKVSSPTFTQDDDYKFDYSVIAGEGHGFKLEDTDRTLDVLNHSYINVRPEYFEPARIYLHIVGAKTSTITTKLNGLSFTIRSSQKIDTSSDSFKEPSTTYYPDGTDWKSTVAWESKLYAPWGHVIYNIGQGPCRKMLLTVNAYNKGTYPSGSVVESETVNLHNMYSDIVLDPDDDFYEVPQTMQEVMFSAAYNQYKRFFQRGNNGKYDIEFLITIKTLLDGAAQIQKVRSSGDPNWTDWEDDTYPHIRWSRNKIDETDFSVVVFSKLTNSGQPELHWGTQDNSNQFDNRISYRINVVESGAGYEMTFACNYKDTFSNGMIGAVEGGNSVKYVEGEKKSPNEQPDKPYYVLSVKQYVRFGNQTYEATDVRRFYFRHIISLYNFHESVYSVQPTSGSQVDIVFDHAEQTNAGLTVPVPSSFQLKKENIILSEIVGPGTLSQLTIGDIEYRGGISGYIHITVNSEITESTTFKFTASNESQREMAEITEDPVVSLVADSTYIWKITFYKDGDNPDTAEPYWIKQSGESLILPNNGFKLQEKYGEEPLMRVYAKCNKFFDKAIFFDTSHFTRHTGCVISPVTTGYAMNQYSESGQYVYHAASFKYNIGYGQTDKNHHYITSHVEPQNPGDYDNRYFFYLRKEDSATAAELYNMRVYVKPMVIMEIIESPLSFPGMGSGTYHYKVWHEEILRPDATITDDTVGVPAAEITVDSYSTNLNALEIIEDTIDYNVINGQNICEFDVHQEGSMIGYNSVNVKIETVDELFKETTIISQLYVTEILVEETTTTGGRRTLYPSSNSDIAKLPTSFIAPKYYGSQNITQFGRIIIRVHAPSTIQANQISIDWQDLSSFMSKAGYAVFVDDQSQGQFRIEWPSPSETTYMRENQNMYFMKNANTGYYYTDAHTYRPLLIGYTGGTTIQLPFQLEPVQQMDLSGSEEINLYPEYNLSNLYFIHLGRVEYTTQNTPMFPYENDRIKIDNVTVTKINDKHQSVTKVSDAIASYEFLYVNTKACANLKFNVDNNDPNKLHTIDTGIEGDGRYYLTFQKGNNFLRWTLIVNG